MRILVLRERSLFHRRIRSVETDHMADEERIGESVRQMVGSLSHATSPDPAAFERSNYMKALVSYSGTPAQPWAG